MLTNQITFELTNEQYKLVTDQDPNWMEEMRKVAMKKLYEILLKAVEN